MTWTRAARGAAVIVLLLLARQLWLISRGTLGRAQFESLSLLGEWKWQLAFGCALVVHVVAALAVRGEPSASPAAAVTPHEPGRRNLRRLCGGLALLFAVLHAWSMGAFGGRPPEYEELCASFSATTWGVPWRAAGYLLGIAALAAHVGMGTAHILKTRGAAPAPTKAVWLAYGLAVLLALPGLSAVFRLATGSGAIFVGFG